MKIWKLILGFFGLVGGLFAAGAVKLGRILSLLAGSAAEGAAACAGRRRVAAGCGASRPRPAPPLRGCRCRPYSAGRPPRWRHTP